MRDLRKSPLRMAFSLAEGARVTETLVADALQMAVSAGILGRSSSTTRRSFEGTVTGIVAGRAIVRDELGRTATIVPELVAAGVPIESMVRRGMRLAGALDDGGRLDISFRAGHLLRYQPGQVVLARVTEATADTAALMLHPDITVTVRRDHITANDLDRVDDLMTVGEVLRARIVSDSPWSLRLDDLDDDEVAVPAFTLFDGGPPWLAEGLPQQPEVAGRTVLPSAPSPLRLRDTSPHQVEETAEPHLVPTPAPHAHPTPIPHAPPRDGLAASQAQQLDQANEKLREHRQTIAHLHDEKDEVVAELEWARQRADELSRKLAKVTHELRKARAAPGPTPDDLFADPVEQFNFELYTAWARRVPAAEKSQRPLRSCALGPDFLDSIDRLHGVSRSKIVDVVVEVLTGIAEAQPGRALHRLRTALAGDAPVLTRADGATAWRVSLQTGSPSARRLHFWRRHDGSIELGKVVLHNDFTI
ncbi:hypothetical protein [Nocardioides ultimimeridianus]